MTDEPVTQIKKSQSTSNLVSTNKLSQVAKHLEFDAKVKQAEDSVMVERKENLKQLKAIKGYLMGIKTGDKAKIYQSKRSTKT